MAFKATRSMGEGTCCETPLTQKAYENNSSHKHYSAQLQLHFAFFIFPFSLREGRAWPVRGGVVLRGAVSAFGDNRAVELIDFVGGGKTEIRL